MLPLRNVETLFGDSKLSRSHRFRDVSYNNLLFKAVMLWEIATQQLDRLRANPVGIAALHEFFVLFFLSPLDSFAGNTGR
ncbi:MULTISPECIES: hypothetical protein [unclassified Microcoleus]|uniref:hypothetical protein n=1 Tax=unclassified Microcoleus TaxID=2642155 RepID=UPI002FD6329C